MITVYRQLGKCKLASDKELIHSRNINPLLFSKEFTSLVGELALPFCLVSEVCFSVSTTPFLSEWSPLVASPLTTFSSVGSTGCSFSLSVATSSWLVSVSSFFSCESPLALTSAVSVSAAVTDSAGAAVVVVVFSAGVDDVVFSAVGVASLLLSDTSSELDPLSS